MHSFVVFEIELELFLIETTRKKAEHVANGVEK